jgi:hypothetical protein
MSSARSQLRLHIAEAARGGRPERCAWQRETIDRVLDVLERKGIEFIENGVRLVRKPHRR